MVKKKIEEIAVPELKTRVEFTSTGSILLNLAMSGRGRNGGYARGRIINLVGDGSSGKTLLALEACAQAYYNLNKTPVLFDKVKKIIIVYNNVEGVMDFPIEEMYGEDFVKSIEWVRLDTAEKAGNDYLRRVKALKSGEYLLYVMDSLDAMVSEAGKERAEEAIKKDKIQDGSYSLEKQKYFSSTLFPRAVDYTEGKDSTLICISQVRENINAGLFGTKHYRVGGKALDFYTHQVAWLAKIGNLSREFKAKKKVYGIRIKAKLNRNKVAKPFREAEFDILFDYGVDDIGSMLTYLYGGAKEILWNGQEMKRIDLIKFIEDDKTQYDSLINLIEKDWNEAEEKIKPKRKKRFK
jgi:recombination protein RecA